MNSSFIITAGLYEEITFLYTKRDMIEMFYTAVIVLENKILKIWSE